MIIDTINQLFPNKRFTHRLSALINELSSTISHSNLIFLAIEKPNNSRLFTYFKMDELIILYQCTVNHQRTIYETILPSSVVKAYIDYEYNLESNADIQNHHVGTLCVLKILNFISNFFCHASSITNRSIDQFLQQFLIVES